MGGVVSLDPEPVRPFTRRVRAVLVADVVESVRLIEQDEEAFVRRWRAFVAAMMGEEFPTHGGRLVKSLGDGMLVELDTAQAAVNCALAVQARMARVERHFEPQQQIRLRIGIHIAPVIVDELDLFGEGVNLAARLAALAGPGEIVASAALREALTPVLDADVEDLGDCHLKHVRLPVRAYRIGPPGDWPVIEPGTSVLPELRPTIAVIPFAGRGVAPEHAVLGEVLAEEIISALSRTPELNVISRLSTTAFGGRQTSLAEVQAHLRANYVVSGGYRVAGARVTLAAELAEARSGHVVWSDRLQGDVGAIVGGDDDLTRRIVAAIGHAVTACETERALSHSMPTLESYTLLLGAVALMHRLSPCSFERARQMLQALKERVPRHAIPDAWLAKWYVLRVQQGWSADPKLDARQALDCTRRALDADAHCALAMAIDGFVHTNLLKRLDIAEQRYDMALDANPNESLAWLLKGTLHAFKGEGRQAVDSTLQALRLSPLDPLKYFYDSLAATAALAAGEYERAIEHARRSLRANRTHTSTLRALAIAQVQTGRDAEARETVRELLRLEPTLTVRAYLERSPSSAFETGRIWSGALRAAGLPEGD
jgi:class 3 adenylate cyclase/TolB-like protein